MKENNGFCFLGYLIGDKKAEYYKIDDKMITDFIQYYKENRSFCCKFMEYEKLKDLLDICNTNNLQKSTLILCENFYNKEVPFQHKLFSTTKNKSFCDTSFGFSM